MVLHIIFGPLCIRLCCDAMRDRSVPTYNVLDVTEARQRQRERRVSPNVTKGLGIAQLFVALSQFAVGIVILIDLSHDDLSMARIGIPLWVGGWILVTSILTITSGIYTQNSTLISTAKVFNILSTIASGIAGIIFFIGMKYFLDCHQYDYYEYDASEYFCRKKKNEGLALFAVLIGLMVIEFFLSLFSAIYSGSAAGCCGPNYSGVIYTQPNPMTTTTQVISSQTVNMMPTQQPTTHCQQMPQQYATPQANVYAPPPPYTA